MDDDNMDDDIMDDDIMDDDIMDDDIMDGGFHDEEWLAEQQRVNAERQRERDEVMHKIETNDPTFTTLRICQYDDEPPNCIDWGVLGTAIGNNTHLTEIMVQNYTGRNIPAIDIRDFARGLALNRSIQKLNMTRLDHSNQICYSLDHRDPFPHASDEAWEHLTQFFIKNEEFHSLELDLHWNIQRNDELLSALRRFHSLKEFKLSCHNHISDANDVIDALIEHHTSLTKLSIVGFDIGRGGCAALASSSLAELHLGCYVNINEEGARVFATGLARNTTLKVLEIKSSRKITDISWQTIFNAFRTCKVESLVLDFNRLTDATMQSLSNALPHNNTLKLLNLSHNKEISNAGWAALFTVLWHPNSALEKLDVSYNSIGDVGVNALTNALESNCMLKELIIVGNPGVTPAGWVNFSTVLQNPTSALEVINVSNDSINDEVINSFALALSENCMLKKMTFYANDSVTPTGWVNLSNILRNPTSVLEVLTVCSSSINDEVMHAFAGALSNNNTLRELDFLDFSFNEITSDVHAAMTNILCDTSSILNTFNSNHTLTKLQSIYSVISLPNDLLSLLNINRMNSVSQAARLKIITMHFNGSEINMQLFMEMSLCVRPHAIAWMAKDMYLFGLLRAMPSLLEQRKEIISE